MGAESSIFASSVRECFEQGVSAKVKDLEENFGIRTREMERHAHDVMKLWGQTNRALIEDLFRKYDEDNDEVLSREECAKLTASTLIVQKEVCPGILADGVRSIMEPNRQFMIDSGFMDNNEFEEQIKRAISQMQVQVDDALEKLIRNDKKVAAKIWATMDTNNDKMVTKEEFLTHYVDAAAKVVHLQTLLRPPHEFESDTSTGDD